MKHKIHGQMSESFLIAAFLSVSGGLQDAYTYISRGKVFANAQTGNIVLFSQNIIAGNLKLSIHYFIPVIFFALGVAVAECIRQKYRLLQKIHWRQLVLIAEIFLLFIVGFLPEKWNMLANAMVSFACAMQVQAFRKVNGYAFASTMCIGNMRSEMESFCAYERTHDKRILKKSFCYLGIIFMFAFGAGLGGLLIPELGMRTIWISCAILLVSFMFMFIKEEIVENPELKEEKAAIRSDLHNIKEEAANMERILKDDLKMHH